MAKPLRETRAKWPESSEFDELSVENGELSARELSSLDSWLSTLDLKVSRPVPLDITLSPFDTSKATTAHVAESAAAA